ncbi:hypothetical protein Aph02nite_74030 [Actinoplanes philippinensis]|uniref:Uncharacterized protein n=1 Tax=Actinoplanes philippinensis TaxID=35752 RepID=A0A1I2K409_9ACTN|nr:hypothetical protein [Actinoplanes philippinensis]GIE81453.1 hypothetical protein Aph02nite_74030 [Actinoplanes philippinensis]SFF61634.1 hypothetical protein SAMN05421541_11563 [Actinoplanes philippinensis]
MNILAEMLLTEPAPMAIWAALMLLTLPALVVLANPDGVRDPVAALLEAVRFVRRTRRRRAGRRAAEAAEAQAAVRFALELRVAAAQAADAVDRWQAHWQAAADRVDAAWAAFQAADARLARSRATTAFGAPWTPRDPAEYAARERFLHEGVRAAVSRADLPVSALAAVLAGGGGWDPCLHPAEQEIVLHRRCAEHRERAYRAAVAAERTAWHDTQLARRGRDSLQREAEIAESRVATWPIFITAAGDLPLTVGNGGHRLFPAHSGNG